MIDFLIQYGEAIGALPLLISGIAMVIYTEAF